MVFNQVNNPMPKGKEEWLREAALRMIEAYLTGDRLASFSAREYVMKAEELWDMAKDRSNAR